MTKKVKSKQTSKVVEALDAVALLLAFWFVYSVINNTNDLIEQGIKNAPASYCVILASLLIGFRYFQEKKLNTMNTVTLTILATSISIWFFGLSTW
jgi:hypothetical protein